MAFNKRTWKGRQGTGLNKFSINGATPVTVVNQPDSITEVGDALSAGNLNDLEDRIADAFDETASQEEVTDVKNALSSYFNLVNSDIFESTNSAVTSNGDGTYTVGTTDYGTSYFGGAIYLEAGDYLLFGTDAGYSFVNSSKTHSSPLFSNSTSESIKITITTSGTYYVGLRENSAPSTSFVITPNVSLITSVFDYDENMVNAIGSLVLNRAIFTDYSEVESPLWVCSDYLPTSYIVGDIYFRATDYNGVATISFYGADRTPISAIHGNGNATNEFIKIIAVPSNAVYVRFCTLASSATSDKSFFKFQLSEKATYDRFYGGGKSVYIVDKDGNGDFTSIKNAVEGINNDTALHPVTIIVHPATYKEWVNVDSSRYISIIGTSRDTCILRWDTGEYRNEPLIFEGTGIVQNMTIISTYDDVEEPNPSELVAYAVHVDDRQNVANRRQTFINCVMSSNGSSAIGIGLHQGEYVECIGCEFYSHTPSSSSSSINGAFLCHSGSGTNITGQKLLVKDCIIVSDYNKAISITDALNEGGGEMEVTFINNMAYCNENGTTNVVNVTTPVGGHFSGSGISLTEMSYGNNIAMLNA